MAVPLLASLLYPTLCLIAAREVVLYEMGQRLCIACFYLRQVGGGVAVWNGVAAYSAGSPSSDEEASEPCSAQLRVLSRELQFTTTGLSNGSLGHYPIAFSGDHTNQDQIWFHTHRGKCGATFHRGF